MLKNRSRHKSTTHEWMSSVEMTGLMVSEPVLQSHFPNGPEVLPQPIVKWLRNEYERFNYLTGADQQKAQPRFINFVLGQILDIPEANWRKANDLPDRASVDLPTFAQTLKPSRVLPDEDELRLLVSIVKPEQSLDKADRGEGRWKASPSTKMDYLLRGTGVRLGLLTNGLVWRLVYSEPEHSAVQITWTIQNWYDERATLNAFRMLLHRDRLLKNSGQVQLLKLIKESQDKQIEVADQLGIQVREAIEIFVKAMDELDKKHHGELLKDVALDKIYEMTIVVMMRLVFLLYAEENGLLPHGQVLYDHAYGITHLAYRLEQTKRTQEELLEQQTDAWQSLLATFRLIYSGCNHPDFQMKAYGGSLFDPKRFRRPNHSPDDFSILEDPRLQLSNATIHSILHRLTYARARLGQETINQRVSYSTIDVEQIGYMYEGLLDHEVYRAQDVVVRLVGKKQAVYELAKIEEHRKFNFVKWLKTASDRQENVIQKALERKAEPDDISRLISLVANEEPLLNRLLPFIHLIDLTYLARPGDLYVGLGPSRRATGSHYTPQILTQPIVENTLAPLCYENPDTRFGLKSPRELLDLKIADIAMGSGAFLVQAIRYLSERLVESWDALEQQHTDIPITPYGEISKQAEIDEILPIDREERLFIARRLVADRCIYGVDKNPLAVEMARLSLWLVTLAKDKAFTFLDHALKVGDSLLGVDLEQLKTFSLDKKSAAIELISHQVTRNLDDAIKLRHSIQQMRVLTPQDAELKARDHVQAERLLEWLKIAGDLLLGPVIALEKKQKQDELRRINLNLFYQHFHDPENLQILKEQARKQLGEHQPFHWQLEFPEVFSRARGGFDAIVGNPPFKGGQHLTGMFGVPYREYLVNNLAGGKKGSADLCTYFFLQAFDKLAPNGNLGLLATNTISQGDTREAGLELIEKNAGDIYNAVPTMAWPGVAAVHVAKVHIKKGKYEYQKVLDDKKVNYISSFLDSSKLSGKPFRLYVNQDKSFVGSYVLGMGFVLTPEEAQALIDKNPKNKDVLYPYLNGEDLNSRPDQSPSRWVINFHDWPLNRNAEGSWYSASVKQQNEWLRSGIVPGNYPDPVASDFPDCLKIVEEKVKPERTRKKANGKFTLRYPLYLKWWIYGEKRPALYKNIKLLKHTLITATVSPTIAFYFSPVSYVFSHKIIVFPLERFHYFTLIQSSLHKEWAFKFSSTLGYTTLNYSPSDCLETFPFPTNLKELENIGEKYYNHRQSIMQIHHEGLTQTYNRFHDPNDTAADIQKLRELHAQMDRAVADAYAWQDLVLDHDFYVVSSTLNKDGVRVEEIRYTVAPEVKEVILARLLKLNHERYEEEVRQGLHEKKNVNKNKKEKTKLNKKKENPDQVVLL